MNNKEPLIGTDGALFMATDGTEYIGDGIKTLDELAGGTSGDGSGAGWYQVSALPLTGSIFNWNEAQVDDYFYDNGSLLMVSGDKAIAYVLDVTASEDTSIKSFAVNFTKDKIDVTTLVNRKQKVYRPGRADASGTLEGITSVSNDTIRNKFMDVLTVSTTNTKTMIRKNDDPVFMLGFLNLEGITGDYKIAVVGKINLEGVNLGSTGEGSQDFSTAFSPASGDRLQLIKVEIA